MYRVLMVGTRRRVAGDDAEYPFLGALPYGDPDDEDWEDDDDEDDDEDDEDDDEEEEPEWYVGVHSCLDLSSMGYIH